MPRPDKAPSYSKQLARLTQDPVVDYYLARDNSKLICRVTGIQKPFDIVVPKAIIVDAMPLGKITLPNVKEFAMRFVRDECRQRGII